VKRRKANDDNQQAVHAPDFGLEFRHARSNVPIAMCCIAAQQVSVFERVNLN